jgi:hypothetical protein
MRKVARGSDPAFEATHLGQGLALDVGFMFQRSKNKNRADLLTGINGCNAYCIVYDFLTEVIFGITLIGKLTPLTWLHILLTRIAPPASVTRRIVRMDLGGETGLNPDINALLTRHCYVTQPTGASASNQNPTAERPHQTIANAIRAMLFGANIPPKYWEYAFYFFLRIHTVLPHGKKTVSPYHMATNRPADLTRLRTFGCVIYALSTKKRIGKLTMENVSKGIFLGYGASMKTFIYENIRTRRICRATHATFDEAQLNALPRDLSPNSKALWSALSSQPGTPLDPSDTVLTPPENFCVFAESSPFLRTFVVRIAVLCAFPHLGLLLVSDPMSRRNIVSEVTEFSSAAKIDWEHDLRYRTIIQVDDTPVFLVTDVHKALADVDQATHESIRLIVAQYRADPESAPTPNPQIAIDQMRTIHHVLHGWDLSDPVLRVQPETSQVLLVTADNAGTMAAGQKNTRRTCLNGPHRENGWKPSSHNSTNTTHMKCMGSRYPALPSHPPAR